MKIMKSLIFFKKKGNEYKIKGEAKAFSVIINDMKLMN